MNMKRLLLFFAAGTALAQILMVIVNDKPASSDPCGSGYAHCLTLEMPGSGITGETDFVAPYTFSGSDYLKTVGNGGYVVNTVTQTGGSGLTVPADGIFVVDGTPCDTPVDGWEWGAYSGTTGNGAAYINFGTAANSKKVKYCVGKASVTTWQGDVPGTWPGYASVNHWGDGTTLDLHDSTSNAYLFTNISATAGAGIVAGGVVTDTNKVVDSPTVTALSTDITVSVWIKTSDASNQMDVVYAVSSTKIYAIQLTSGTPYFVSGYNSGSPGYVAGTGDVRNGAWHHIVGVYDDTAGSLKIYQNGSLTGTAASGNVNPAPYTSFRVGSYQTDQTLDVFTGTSSELFRSGSITSANRIAMEYAAFSAPTSWLTLAVIQ